MDFEIELRLGVAERSQASPIWRLVLRSAICRKNHDNGGRLKALAGAQNTVPEVVRGDDGEADGFASFFSHAEGLRKRCCSMLPKS